MSRFDLIAYGPQTVSLTKNGQTSNATGNVQPEVIAASEAVYVLDATKPADVLPTSVTIARADTFPRNNRGFSPIFLANSAIVESVSGNNVFLPVSKLASIYTPAMYDRGAIQFRRIINGVMSVVAESTITAAAFPNSNQISGENRIVTGTTFTIKHNTYNLQNSTYWAVVKAVDNAGRLGPGTTVSYTLPTFTTESNPTNTTSALTIVSGSASLLAPTGVTATPTAGSNLVPISWNAVSGAVGYVVIFAVTDPATWPAGEAGYLTVASASGVQAGDLAIWRVPGMKAEVAKFSKRVYAASEATEKFRPGFIENANLLNDPAGTNFWEIKEFDGGFPAPTGVGKYYLERIYNAGYSINEGRQMFGGLDQTARYVKKPGDVLRWRCQIWASRAFTLTFSSDQPGEPTQNVVLSSGWNTVDMSSSFAVAPNGPSGSGVYYLRVRGTVTGSPLTLRYAKMECWLENKGNIGEFTTDIAATIPDGIYLRDHNLIKSQLEHYDGDIALASPVEGYNGWSLQSHLATCNQVGGLPWLQLEWALFRSDYDKIGAWIVANMASFSGIRVEFGNENWNGLASFWPIPSMTDSATGTVYTAGEVYGIMSKMLKGWLEAVSGWSGIASKVKYPLGGWNNQSFGTQAFRYFPEASSVTIANYVEGWEKSNKKVDETGDSFQRGLQFYGGRDAIVDQRSRLASAIAAYHPGKAIDVDVRMDYYEAGAGYQIDGINGSLTLAEQIVQEVQRKSRAMITAQLDAFCVAADLGCEYNFFTIQPGGIYASHRNDGVEYGIWAVLRCMFESIGIARSHSVARLKGGLTSGIEDTGVFAFQSKNTPSKWLLSVLNRTLNRAVLDPADPLYSAGDTGTKAITICTPWASATGCRIWTAGIGNMREHNRYLVGKRAASPSGLVDDPLCVEFNYDWTTVSVPSNLSRLAINSAVGADAGGLRGGNCLMIELTGVA